MRRNCILLLLFLYSVLLGAWPIQHSEQTGFGAEGDFDRPVALSAAALEALRAFLNNEEFRDCAEQEGISPNDISRSWFSASEIRLTKSPASGLIVRGEAACMHGAHIVDFWVLAKSKDGYRIVFQGRADALRVLPTRTNGYRDLELVIITAAGANIDNVQLHYEKGEYRPVGHHVSHN